MIIITISIIIFKFTDFFSTTFSACLTLQLFPIIIVLRLGSWNKDLLPRCFSLVSRKITVFFDHCDRM